MDITLSFIETAVAKALRDIARDPERSVRNAVDLGRNFSKGRFQKRFMQSAQTMLKNGQSAYYGLARRIIAEVNHDTLRTFGINMGYHGFTRGAKIIRQQEAALGINIPWTVAFAFRNAPGCVGLDTYARMIEEGMALGIHTYLVFCGRDEIAEAQALFARFERCAFILFLQEEGQAEEAMDGLGAHHNVMVALGAGDPKRTEAAALLRAQGSLISLYAHYDDASAKGMMEEGWLTELLPTGCAFILLMAKPGTSQEARLCMERYVRAVREGQRYPVFLMDYYSDLLLIDEAISEESCFLGIDEEGFAYALDASRRTQENIEKVSLLEMLRRTMPRAAGR